MPGAERAGGDPRVRLDGRVVLVTRPREQSAALVRAIEAAGARAQVLPSLEIVPLAGHPALDAALAALAGYDLVVFVSVNAVRAVADRCAALGVGGLGRIGLAASPGPATAAALRAAGARCVVAPARRFDSEGLIEALSARASRPARALILRGADGDEDDAGGSGAGRDELARWLSGGGAAVEVLACYRRVRARLLPADLAALIAGRRPDAALIASAEGGRALAAMLGTAGMAWLAPVPVLVPHERIARAMAGLGFVSVHVTEGGQAGLVRGLARQFGGAGRG